jgi:hypothetical protein
MTKSLNDILKGVKKSKVVPGSTGTDPGVDYAEKSKDGRDFVAQHKVEKHEDRVGNGDDVYKASKVKQSKDENHGHTPDPKAKSAYKQHNEEVDQIDEKMSDDNKASDALRKVVAKHKLKDAAKETRPGYVKKQSQEWYNKMTKRANAKIEEAKDPREYDYEGEMAISQIKSIMNHSEQLMGMLKPDTNLPEWVQSKITLAKDYIQTAADYFATEMSEANCGSDEQPMYNGKKKKGRQLLTDKKLKEEQIEERKMTAADKKKEEKLKSKYDDSGMKASMQKQYGAEKGKQVYFAYIRKKAMKSEQADTHIKMPSGGVGDTGRV